MSTTFKLTMLSNTLALGLTTTLLSFEKQFADAGVSKYSVQGLTAATARTLSFKHEITKAGVQRSALILDEVDPVSGSTTGQTTGFRLQVTMIRPPGKTAAECKAAFARLKTFVDSTAMQDQFLNQEV
jgi:hypothetical protein